MASSGGGIYNAGTLTVANGTFTGNGGEVQGIGDGLFNSGALTLRSTIIAHSSGGGDCVNSGGTVDASSRNNLIEDSANACGLVNGQSGNLISVDPRLGALTGSPAYFPLLFGSPAIDAGDNATCAAAPVSNQSENGVTRHQDGDGDGQAVCDIGAYEALPPQPTSTPTPSATPTQTPTPTPSPMPTQTPTPTLVPGLPYEVRLPLIAR